jgi:hypothetical protein
MTRQLTPARLFLGVVVCCAVLATCGRAATTAMAGPSVWWDLTASTWPANLPAGGEGTIDVVADNIGDRQATTGSVTISDKLPPGLSVRSISFFTLPTGGPNLNIALLELGLCETTGRTVSCRLPLEEFGIILNQYEYLEMRIVVKDEGAVSGALNEATIAGASAAAPKTLQRPIHIGGSTAFGVEDLEVKAEEEGGTPTTHAGAHPFQLTTNVLFNQSADTLKQPAKAKDVAVKLPPGLIGNPSVIPQCTTAQFFSFVALNSAINLCPPSTAVGVADITIDEPDHIKGITSIPVPIFNVTPAVGEPARFAFEIFETVVILDTAVRTGSDYGVTVRASNISELTNFISSRITFWGVPGDPRHNDVRGWCMQKFEEHPIPCVSSEPNNPPPFLAMPTSCGPLSATVEADSWQQAGVFGSLASEPMTAMDSCNELQFAPEVKIAPDGQEASKPTGLAVEVHVPQEVNENSAGAASSNVKSIEIAFPEGVTLNPAAADGLQACSEDQIGLLGGMGAQGELLFTPTLPQAFCPSASKIATVKIKSPLLPANQPLEGAMYLATPAPNGEAGENPFNSFIGLYIVAEDPVSGTLVKLPGRGRLDPVTGQLVSTFENTPQLAFEDAEIHLFGGERAPLSTPSHCGTYTTNATFTPWSGSGPVRSSSSFQITSGPNGTACPPAALPFAPSLAAGTTNNNAGAFSPLTTTMSREDGNQNIDKVQLHMPPGLSGILTGIPLCPEEQANAGTCGQGSLIGHTVVSVGLGGDPFSVTGGEVFLTEKIAGSPSDAPFGLSIVNPAVAGPFNLGKVIVRGTIEVDPHTAQLTVTTGEIPHILDGVPLQIKHVNVTIDRPGFTFNPTSCSKTALTGDIGSVEGASSAVSVPFQVTNCASLKFAPKFSVSTNGKTSRAKGASLHVKLTYPQGPTGTYANIARVKVDLPKQLPSQLKTLQKACAAAQFEADPANCPTASKVGFARAITPLVPVPLEGPAVFVSHGNEAFPSLVLVLQGYGVTIDLVGTTFISRKGITSSTFKTVPDQPIGSFELNLPQGEFSALAANGNLCRHKLAMPTEFVAQNGAKIDQSTKVAVTGCAKAHKLRKVRKGRRKARNRKR